MLSYRRETTLQVALVWAKSERLQLGELDKKKIKPESPPFLTPDLIHFIK